MECPVCYKYYFTKAIKEEKRKMIIVLIKMIIAHFADGKMIYINQNILM